VGPNLAGNLPATRLGANVCGYGPEHGG